MFCSSITLEQPKYCHLSGKSPLEDYNFKNCYYTVSQIQSLGTPYRLLLRQENFARAQIEREHSAQI